MKILSDEQKSFVERECTRILASDAFVRSPMLSKLLAFLRDCTLKNHQPKEITIGIEVFNKPSSFDPSEDAFVRVYIHKLRSRMAAFYENSASQNDGVQDNASSKTTLIIPKGSYQLMPYEVVEAEPTTESGQNANKSRITQHAYIAFVLSACMLIAALVFVFTPIGQQIEDAASSDASSARTRELALQNQLSDTPKLAKFWSGFMANDFPTYIVLGDLFMFEYSLGPNNDEVTTTEDSQSSAPINTLMRNYDVNSQQDFEQWQADNPQYASRVAPSANRFLMQSSAYTLISLHDVMSDAGKVVKITTLSDVDAKDIRDANFVYVGMIKSMGFLRTYFEQSQFSCENNCKNTLSTDTGYSFVGEGQQSQEHTDYAVVAKTTRDNGAVSLFLAGFSDTGIMQAVRTVTDDAELANTQAQFTHIIDVAASAPLSSDISLLFEAKGFDYADYAAKLIMVNSQMANEIKANPESMSGNELDVRSRP
ncbi:hypothetical protein ACFO4O_17805 [Glaciecola siphonariae]|uniref:Uncharacterized protein n=1 Tax=Glaciecola siphonariae TaxID=521012 RepID=A0ABV9M1K8_9ALTE